MIRKFTLYWLDGRRDVVEGSGFLKATAGRGLGGLAFYMAGDDRLYRWSEQARKWLISMPARPLGSATPSLPPHSSASHYS